MRRYFSFALFLLIALQAASADKPTMQATRITDAPKMDGVLDDEAWQHAVATDMTITLLPVFGKAPSEHSSIKVVYDNVAIYVGAYLYDDHPTEIKHQLSQRDDAGALADNFMVGLDTYNDGINGYRFQVTTAGVQYDEKASSQNPHDASWDAVWESATAITHDGWICEIKIPYSAIRFPSSPTQDWGLQFGRNIIRLGELDAWSPVDPKVIGSINQWGKLIGLHDIKPPLRLSISPYLTAGVDISPSSYDPLDYGTGRILSGGADIKYGINESFTLDATLIPDFGQVQSDNLVLNISPFETKFDEKRPFFTEGTELFQQDNTSNGGGSPQLFYSRRIGGTPFHYWDAYLNVDSNETLKQNPTSSNLYNAIKLSGRTNNGLGIGVLNAVTRPAYATIRNNETGSERKYETNPITNYNVIVFDQTLRNNSKLSFENTNVLRNGSDPDANVSSIHFDLRDKANVFQAAGFANYSMIFNSGHAGNPVTGGYYNVSFNEIKGKWNEWVWNEMISPGYNQNDLGILYYNNQMTNGAGFSYNNSEPKKGPFFNVNGSFNINYKTRVQPLHYEEWELNGNFNSTFKNYWYLGGGIYSKPVYYWDYYESRVDSMPYHHYPIYVFNAWFGTDYRKRATLNAVLTYGEAPGPHNPFYGLELDPNLIVTDKLNLAYSIYLSKDLGTYGFALFDDHNNVIFGQRNTSTIINTLNIKYIFTPRMDVSFRARYYWSKVNYTGYYQLLQNGELGTTDYTGNNDINYNVFNIDAVYAWEFLPGSFLNLIWKNSIMQSDDLGADNYFLNCSKTIEAPQSNGISLKVIYYLDYNTLRKRTA